MKYSEKDVLQYIAEEDVKFVRLAFCDVLGVQKNVCIPVEELAKAFKEGVSIDASAIKGFGDETRSDLFLQPDASTLSVLPWRPEQGKVIRFFCDVTYPDGSPFENDSRAILKNAVKRAEQAGLEFFFGAEMEFYLFGMDENGERFETPYDRAGYMDVAPYDKGENIRRQICLTLERMGIRPESAHHEEGPGQNEIDFKYAAALNSADDALTFRSVVQTVAGINGLYADFSSKPIADQPGNGFHVNLSVVGKNYDNPLSGAVAGIINRIREITLFLNPSEKSFDRLGNNKAPGYVAWSKQNRSSVIRIPATRGKLNRLELRSPDPLANPYLAYALIIDSAMEGIVNGLPCPNEADINFFTANEQTLLGYERLPVSLEQAKKTAAESSFVHSSLPESLIEYYLNNVR